MAKEILLINPRRPRKRRKKATTKRKVARKRPVKARKTVKRRTVSRHGTGIRRKIAVKTAKKGSKSMPKKKKSTTKRRRYRKNPGRARKAVRRAGGAFRSLSFRAALASIWQFQLGMIAAKWASKRGSAEFPATETDPASWNYTSYLKAGIGSVVAATGANLLKPGSGQKVLEGGLNFLVFKLIQNELIPRSEFAMGQLGAVMQDESGVPMMMTNQGPMPLDESHRVAELPEMAGYDEGYYGDDIVPVSELGEATVFPGPLGNPIDAYYKAFHQE